jgi:hypothetical protein
MTGGSCDVLDGIFGDLADIKSKLETLYGTNRHFRELVEAFKRIERRLEKLQEENYQLCYLRMVVGSSALSGFELPKDYMPPRSCLNCPYHDKCSHAIASRSGKK